MGGSESGSDSIYDSDTESEELILDDKRPYPDLQKSLLLTQRQNNDAN